jgi:hypothetical protein
MDPNRTRSLGQLAAFVDVRLVEVLLFLDPLELIRLQAVSHGKIVFDKRTTSRLVAHLDMWLRFHSFLFIL